ncbi:MAG: molybdopterin adenylyltransferase [Candidatus Methylopumilus sp.]|nr:molybdopterin adenylyltransferase [Candidatus Methylopumilus sp.]
MENKFTKIGLISISDRASKGEYVDQGIPNLQAWLQKAIASPFQTIEKIIPDEKRIIESTLIHFVEKDMCDLILTTGGTGPALRDVTPEATMAIADRDMPGFGEQMRQIGLHFVPTAILSRQVAVIRKNTLIINLPGQPKSIAQTLEGLKDNQGKILVHGIFSAVPYCIDLLNGPFIETHTHIVETFRPKK